MYNKCIERTTAPVGIEAHQWSLLGPGSECPRHTRLALWIPQADIFTRITYGHHK